MISQSNISRNNAATVIVEAIPDRKAFSLYANSYNLIPVCFKQKSDTLTPITIFKRLRQQGPCFLLESAEGDQKQARYSIIGRDPLIAFCSNSGEIELFVDGCNHSSNYGTDPIAVIRHLLNYFKIPDELESDGYRCGLTGYFAYDFVRYIEQIPDNNLNDIDLPDCSLIAPREVVVYDHLRHEMTLICNVIIPPDITQSSLDDKYDEAVSTLAGLRLLLAEGQSRISEETIRIDTAGFRSNMSRDEYMGIVERAKSYIRTGDIFQAVLSQRFSTNFAGDALEVYRSLRNVSPSPYLFFLQFEDFCLAGASPEMLVRLNRGLVETSPIAGTRKRGKNTTEDSDLAAELINDTKEMSEHAMLTDLARNDIGRICSFGSIQVTEYAQVELFSHVMHIVSKVEGKLEADKSAIDVLCALLPAGTLSGAPKIRAMEIIDELETLKRGPYGGAAGYLSFDGAMNTCITIRTALIAEGKIHVQSGAGIVADSKPDAEYDECVNKAAAMIAAIEQTGDFL